jgi:hypothetical protein
VLPGLFRIHRFLTPLAAAGLAIIMTGATVLTAASGSLPGSLFPFAVGVVVVVFMKRGGRGAITRTGTRRLELQNA